MMSFYAYLEVTSEYLGEIQAIDQKTAESLAEALWAAPVKLMPVRLNLSHTIAA